MILELTQYPRTKTDWARWAFCNMAHHRDIIRLITRDQNIQLDEYVLDPIDRANFPRWLEGHQIMHNQMNAALDVESTALNQVNLRDPEDVANWLLRHANEHIRAGDILNLG